MPSFSSVMQLFLPTIYLFIPLFISLIRRTQARPEINVNTGYFLVEISPLNCFCFTWFFFFLNKKHISPKEKEGSRYFSDFYGSFSWFPQHSPVSGPDSNTSGGPPHCLTLLSSFGSQLLEKHYAPRWEWESASVTPPHSHQAGEGRNLPHDNAEKKNLGSFN